MDDGCLPAVQVTKVVGQHLELVCREGTVVPQHLVVTRSAGALDTLVTQQVKVSLGWMVDPWSTTVPAKALPFLYLLLSAGKNLNRDYRQTQ